MDMWCARSPEEGVFARELHRLRGIIGAWYGLRVTADMNEEAVLWTSRRLPGHYRTLKMATLLFWPESVRYERRSRSAVGNFVLYHNLEVVSWEYEVLTGRYVSFLHGAVSGNYPHVVGPISHP